MGEASSLICTCTYERYSLKTDTQFTNFKRFPNNEPDIYELEEQNTDNNDFERMLMSACLEFGGLSHQQEHQNHEIENLEMKIDFLECDLHDIRNDAFECETEHINSQNFKMGFTVELNETANREPAEEEIPSRNAWLKVERAKSEYNRKRLEATATAAKLEAVQNHIKDLSKELFLMEKTF